MKKQALTKRPGKKSTSPARSKKARHTKKGIKPAAGGGSLFHKELTAKQQQFVLEYLANGFNATKAAIAAGYKKANADTQGSRMLASPRIAAELAERTRQMCEKREITAERVLDEIAKMAYLDPRKLFTLDGQLVPVHLLGDDTAASVAGVDVVERRDGSLLKKIKIADKRGSLELLGRYLKLFTDKVEHSGSLGVQLITTVPRPQRKALPKEK